MPSEDQELFQVQMDGTDATISKIDHVGDAGSELVEPPNGGLRRT